MRKILVLALGFVLLGGVPAFASNDSHQSVSVDMPIAAGSNNIGKVNIEASLPVGGNIVGSVAISSFNVPLPTGNNNVGDVDIASIATGLTTVGSVTMLGNMGVAVKTDAAGQIYAIASTVAGTDIEKTVAFSAIAIGDAWVEVGSYTVTTGKVCKVFEIGATGGFDNEIKISDGTDAQDIYLQTSPSSPMTVLASSHPKSKAAETVITIYARSYDTGNRGTVRLQMFEY